MSSSLPSAITTELAKDSITYVDLIELHFDSDLKTLTNGQYPVTATTSTSGGSQTYDANLLSCVFPYLHMLSYSQANPMTQFEKRPNQIK